MINRFQRFLTRKKIKLDSYTIHIPNLELALCYDYSRFDDYYCNMKDLYNNRHEFEGVPAIAIGDFRPLSFRECAVQLSRDFFGTPQCLYTEKYKHINQIEFNRVKEKFDKRMKLYVNSN